MIADTVTSSVEEIYIKRTPLPGFERVPALFPKVCGCGKSYSLADWCRLPHAATSKIWPINAAEAGEMRDCPCKSTLLVRMVNPSVTLTAEEIAENAELDRLLEENKKLLERLKARANSALVREF